MTPLLLLEYLASVAGGLLLIGLAGLFVLFAAALIVGWTRRPNVNTDGS